MIGSPLSVSVRSEVGRLQAICLHPPGDAHRQILPEHIEAHLSLFDYLSRATGLTMADLDSVHFRIGKEEVAHDLSEPIVLSWRSRDGRKGLVELGGSLRSLFVENPQYVLFDDLVDVTLIRREYMQFERLIRTIAPRTFRFTELVLDALYRLHLDPELEAAFFDRLRRCSLPSERKNVEQAKEYFATHGPRPFLMLLTTGRDHRGNYVFHPLPNLIFTRDLLAAVGDRLVICSPAKPARRREGVLAWLVAMAHPLFVALREAGDLVPVDMLGARLERPGASGLTIEGGDILHLGEGTLLIGLGERTKKAAACELARRLWPDGKPVAGFDRILCVEIIAKRAAMHLDTIFTILRQSSDSVEAMVYEPYARRHGFGEVTAYELRPETIGRIDRPEDLESRRYPSFEDLLQEGAGLTMSPILCGGEARHPVDEIGWSKPESVFLGKLPNERSQKREQWTDGANLFALAPGIVTTYARNRKSLAELSRAGYEIQTVETFCRNAPKHLNSPDSRIVIPIEGSELCRGRGGPRCLTMPLLRRDL